MPIILRCALHHLWWHVSQPIRVAIMPKPWPWGIVAGRQFSGGRYFSFLQKYNCPEHYLVARLWPAHEYVFGCVSLHHAQLPMLVRIRMTHCVYCFVFCVQNALNYIRMSSQALIVALSVIGTGQAVFIAIFCLTAQLRAPPVSLLWLCVRSWAKMMQTTYLCMVFARASTFKPDIWFLNISCA